MGKARLTSIEGDDPVALLKQKVQRIYARQAKKDANVVSAIDRGAGMTEEELERLSALPEDQLRAAGWTPRRLQIARRGLLPKRDVPFALSSAHERNMARIRRTEDAPSGMRLGVAIVNLPPRAERQGDERVVIIEAQEVKG